MTWRSVVFSGYSVFSSNKTTDSHDITDSNDIIDSHDITEILLNVAFNTIGCVSDLFERRFVFQCTGVFFSVTVVSLLFSI